MTIAESASSIFGSGWLDSANAWEAVCRVISRRARTLVVRPDQSISAKVVILLVGEIGLLT